MRKWLGKLDSKGFCVNVRFPEKDPDNRLKFMVM